uniref:Uncharacterized protein n=1 Tax=Ascaris lumbricoides TaxID=6252 RepID=A0A9J2Q8P5_ASCLU
MDAFLDEYLSPTQIPTVFISALPLRPDEPPFTKVFYPDNIRDDKQVSLSDLRERSWYYVCVEWENFNRHNESTGTDCRILRTLDRFGKNADTTVVDIEIVDIESTTMRFRVSLSDLRERSWYYVCVEWENFNRHNESTGTDCRILRTLDRFGKNADTTVVDIEIVDIESTTMRFRVRSLVDFPMRLTASLQGGSGPLVPSQVFNYRESSDLEIIFSLLKQDVDYGKFCLLEEPLVTGYTAMGRLIAGINIEKCYFGKLHTKDYELSTFDSEASPYKRAASASTSFRQQLFMLSITIMISFSVTLLC